jgi:hypothetical protein
MRAMYTDMNADFAVHGPNPLPYAAMVWIFKNHPGDSFLGNPRISFAHQATRGRGLTEPRRQARAWACWYLACQCLPHLDDDLPFHYPKPDLQSIQTLLLEHGLPGETDLWQQALDSCTAT